MLRKLVMGNVKGAGDNLFLGAPTLFQCCAEVVIGGRRGELQFIRAYNSNLLPSAHSTDARALAVT